MYYFQEALFFYYHPSPSERGVRQLERFYPFFNALNVKIIRLIKNSYFQLNVLPV